MTIKLTFILTLMKATFAVQHSIFVVVSQRLNMTHLVYISKCSSVVCSNILSIFFCSLRTHLISGMILVRPSLNPLNYLILLPSWIRGRTRFEIYVHYTRHLFLVDLPRTVCGSVCLSVKKITPFVKIFDVSTIECDIVEKTLSLYDGSAVFPIVRDWVLWRNAG